MLIKKKDLFNIDKPLLNRFEKYYLKMENLIPGKI